MNIENISTLMGQLQSLGFENAGYSLVKRISFKPENFILSQKIDKGIGKLIIQLYFQKDAKQDAYALMFYDAILQNEVPLSESTVNRISIVSLEKSMKEVDWKNAFDFAIQRPFNATDKSSWEKEQKVEAVIEELKELEKSDEGKAVAINLKLKYWVGIAYQDLFGNIAPVKNKGEVSQRFYFSGGGSGISVDEAYRFLQNKLMEKQMQVKRKQADELPPDKADNHSSGSSLLKKRRVGRAKGAKSNKQIHT